MQELVNKATLHISTGHPSIRFRYKVWPKKFPPAYMCETASEFVACIEPLFSLLSKKKNINFDIQCHDDICKVLVTMTYESGPLVSETPIRLVHMRLSDYWDFIDFKRVTRMILKQWLMEAFNEDWKKLADLNDGIVPDIMQDLYPEGYPMWFERVYNPWLYFDYPDGGFLENNPLLFPIQGTFVHVERIKKLRKVTFDDQVQVLTYEIDDNSNLSRKVRK